MAIAFDSSVDGGNNGGGTGLTFAFSNVAGDILHVGFASDVVGGSDDITGVTYNGVSMSLVAKVLTGTAALDRVFYLYELVGPATGSNNVVISASSGHYILAGAFSHSGASQTGQPDNYTTNQSAFGDLTLTTSLTPVADNCWTVLLENGFNNSNFPLAGTGSTRRVYDATFGTWGLFDSNAAITPAASYSMTTTRDLNQNRSIGHIMASIKPPGSSATVYHNGLLLGVGG